MVNFRIISKIIGSLLFLESFFMAICLAMAFSFHEDDVMAFMTSTLMTFGSGCIFMFFGHEAENSLSRRDAYVVVTLTWVVFSFFGMFPFLIHGSVPSVTDAYFETMSGFTTTGATVIDDVESLPHGLLFWRSLMQWIGGLGIVFFTIAILPSLVGGSVRVFAAEATGPMRSKMHPRLSTSAKWIWSIYLLLTIACGLSFWLAGMEWFDATNYSMSTTATGGFSTHNGTIFLASPLIEYLAILFQFLAGINFTLLYVSIFKFKVSTLFKNSEFKVYITTIIIATLWIMYLLLTRMGYDFELAFRSALFQVVSFITTTGLSNMDAGTWPHITWAILGVLMFMGACAGSTTGGFKSIRVMMLFKVLRNEFRHIIHPNAVLPVKMNGQSIPQSRLTTLLAFFTIYVIALALTTIIMMESGVDITNAATISISLISNVGAGLDTNIGPQMSWADLSIGVKWLCSFLMLVGRLEIIAVLVLFTRAFWKEN
ncbi:TrkH family potassium uptake protein [Prevotella sp. E15-22]|jgi:trk system potassium uptake protein TrkH|uniref:TrkH family potassium uptake protein n=1 Tax=Prevotella sp. E15-22 TaxID=2937774 RepID=UPI0020690F40|nr:TrkH family potassium uptake protein [Prevotella sp. E15-22]UPS43817.1 TrkH family potassium uptake protein [Prevotella sp. E15-22]